MYFLVANGDIGNEVIAAGSLAFAALVAVSDLATHRIPNVLTVPGAALGLVLNGAFFGAGGLLHAAEGLLVGLSVFLPFFLARGFGAGDIKAMAAVGAYLGPHGALFAALWTLVAGRVGGVVMLVLARPAALAGMARRWMFRAYVLCATGSRARIEPEPDDPTRRRFPYGLAIACGTLIILVWS